MDTDTHHTSQYTGKGHNNSSISWIWNSWKERGRLPVGDALGKPPNYHITICFMNCHRMTWETTNDTPTRVFTLPRELLRLPPLHIVWVDTRSLPGVLYTALYTWEHICCFFLFSFMWAKASWIFDEGVPEKQFTLPLGLPGGNLQPEKSP